MGIPIWDYPPLNQPAEQNNAQPTFKRIKSPRCHQNAIISPPSSSSSSSRNPTVSPPPNPPSSQPHPHASQHPIQPPQQQRQRQHRTVNSRSYMTRLSDIPSRSSASNTTFNTSSSAATAAALMHGDDIDYDDPQDLYDEIERATEQLIRARERAARDRQDRQDRQDRITSSASASASSLLASTLPRLPAELAANVERYFYLGQEYHLPDLPRSTRRLPMPDRSLHHHSGRRLHHVPQPDIQGQMLTLAEFLRETSAAVARRDRDDTEQQRPNI